LRATITGAGPIDLERMFEVGDRFIADIKSTLKSVIADRVAPTVKAARVRSAAARQQGRKEQHARVARRNSVRVAGRNAKTSRIVTRQARAPAKAAPAKAPRARVAAAARRSR
jgi:hypothetical protein